MLKGKAQFPMLINSTQHVYFQYRAKNTRGFFNQSIIDKLYLVLEHIKCSERKTRKTILTMSFSANMIQNKINSVILLS